MARLNPTSVILALAGCVIFTSGVVELALARDAAGNCKGVIIKTVPPGRTPDEAVPTGFRCDGQCNGQQVLCFARKVGAHTNPDGRPVPGLKDMRCGCFGDVTGDCDPLIVLSTRDDGFVTATCSGTCPPPAGGECLPVPVKSFRDRPGAGKNNKIEVKCECK